MNALTVQQLHDKFFRDNYEIIPRRPASVRTHDHRTVEPPRPLFGPNDSVRGPTPRERGWTRDEILESMNSGKTIALGTVWDGLGENAKLDAKVAPVRDFVAGFIPGNVVHAVDPGTVISLGRVYLPQVADDERREVLKGAMDEAEEEWKKDERNAAGDKPVTTKDARPAGQSSLFAAAAKHTRDYAAGLGPKRAALTATPATPKATARMSSADFAALRTRKGAA